MKRFLLLVLLASPLAAMAETIAIVGTGDVAKALGPRFADLGHKVVYGSRNPESEKAQALAVGTRGAAVDKPADAALGADTVVLAVPAEVVVDVALGLGDLSGKVIIDPTNAFNFTGDNLVVASTGEPVGVTLQQAIPDAHVVKAFNLLWYRVMIDPELAGGRMTIPLVGDDSGAKAKVAALAESMGFDAMDLGPMRYAREQEGMLILWFNARLAGKPFNYYLRPEKKPAG
ncbi:MAG: NAD(P)-binding domain-containing protein [Pseudomonadota bacterium]